MLDLTVPMVEVWFSGAKLGEYANDIEALKAASLHADSLPLIAESVEYELRLGTMKYIVHRRITGPDAPALGPVLTISDTALTVTLDRPATGPTRIDRYEIERLVGSTWTQIASGLNIFGAGNQYPDTGLSASTAYQYRCRAVDTTERASEYSYAGGTTSGAAVNQAPVWSGPVSLTLLPTESASIVEYCVDPEGDNVLFAKVSSTPSAANIVTVSGPGVVSVSLDCPADTYVLTVSGSDGLLSANGTVTVNVPAQDIGTPINFTATGDGATTINLAWSPAVAGPAPTDYDLDFSATSASGPWTAITIGLVTSYPHTGRTAGVTYFYRVRANTATASSGYATTSGEIVVVVPPSGTTDTNYTYTGSWRGTEDVVQGWDWTMPNGVAKATLSGVFTINNNTYPTGWQGNKIRVINAKWKDLQPTSSTSWNFSSITNYLNDPNYDGVFLNVRGWVTATPTPDKVDITAPTWATGTAYPTYTTVKSYTITSLVAYNDNVKTKHKALIARLGTEGILTSPRIWGQIIHLPSSTRGEEFETMQGNEAATQAAAIEYIQAWATAAGANAGRLMWTDDRGTWPTIFRAAIAAGTGARGGAIELWLWGNYSPGYKEFTQQTWANGYLDVDESGVIISERRGWHDQNEAYTDPNSAVQQQNYRMGHLRMLQMRRMILWVDDGFLMNPKMDNWAGVQAGHTVTTSPEAWICLMRTWTRSTDNGVTSWQNRRVNNFERWLYQRESEGATTPTINKDHGPLTQVSSNKSKITALTSEYWNIDLARQGTSIGIAVDDDFIAVGASDSVCIKVMFVDAGTSSWTLQYTKTNGTTGTKSVTCTDTDVVRTATFFISDFKNPASGTDADFYLKSSNASVPFMFVRVLKV